MRAGAYDVIGQTLTLGPSGRPSSAQAGDSLAVRRTAAVHCTMGVQVGFHGVRVGSAGRQAWFWPLSDSGPAAPLGGRQRSCTSEGIWPVRLLEINISAVAHRAMWGYGVDRPADTTRLPQVLRFSVCLALLPIGGLLENAQQGARRGRRELRRLFREFDEDADTPRPAARRPLAEGSALTATGELFPPGGTVGLILLIAHLRLNEPERVTIAYLAALISEPTRR